MKNKLLEFINLLRENGIDVGVAEEIDAFNSISHTGIYEEGQFKTALQATLIKDRIEIPTFEKLFELFFRVYVPRERFLPTSFPSPRWGEGEVEGKYQRESEKNIEEILQNLLLTNNISDVTRYLLLNDFGGLEVLIRGTGARAGVGSIYSKMQEKFFENAILKEINYEKILEELSRIESYLKEGLSTIPDLLTDFSQVGKDATEVAMKTTLLSQGIQDDIKRFLQSRENLLKEIIRKFITEERLKNQARKKKILENIYEKDFYLYTNENAFEMEKAIERLTRRLKNIFTVKRKKKYLGKIDIKRTIKENIKYEGIPFKPVYTKKIKNKGKVIILCDISSSVLYAAKFMLQFAYTLQDMISRVRSFIFIDDLGEVTDYFKRYSFAEAFGKIFTGEVISREAYTYYGTIFREFHKRYIDEIDRKTLLIILGDARNNYAAPYEEYLKEIKNKVHKIIWFNPEFKAGWGEGDSVMNIYSDYCDSVHEVRNIKLLCDAIEYISRNFII